LETYLLNVTLTHALKTRVHIAQNDCLLHQLSFRCTSNHIDNAFQLAFLLFPRFCGASLYFASIRELLEFGFIEFDTLVV
jgi:hypothetical protein